MQLIECAGFGAVEDLEAFSSGDKVRTLNPKPGLNPSI